MHLPLSFALTIVDPFLLSITWPHVPAIEQYDSAFPGRKMPVPSFSFLLLPPLASLSCLLVTIHFILRYSFASESPAVSTPPLSSILHYILACSLFNSHCCSIHWVLPNFYTQTLDNHLLLGRDSLVGPRAVSMHPRTAGLLRSAI